jgi:hypothetical protein
VEWSTPLQFSPFAFCLFPAVYFLLLALGCRLFKQNPKDAFTGRAAAVAVAVFVAGGFLYVASGLVVRDREAFMQGFRERMQARIDVKELEAWGKSLEGLKSKGWDAHSLTGTNEPPLINSFSGRERPRALVAFQHDGTAHYAWLEWGPREQPYGIYIPLDGRDASAHRGRRLVPWTNSQSVYFFRGGP